MFGTFTINIFLHEYLKYFLLASEDFASHLRPERREKLMAAIRTSENFFSLDSKLFLLCVSSRQCSLGAGCKRIMASWCHTRAVNELSLSALLMQLLSTIKLPEIKWAKNAYNPINSKSTWKYCRKLKINLSVVKNEWMDWRRVNFCDGLGPSLVVRQWLISCCKPCFSVWEKIQLNLYQFIRFTAVC